MSALHLSTVAVFPGASPQPSGHPSGQPSGQPSGPTPRRRPPAFEVDEPLFVGILTALSLAAGLFWAWVAMTPTPEHLLLDGDALGLVRDLPPPVRLTLELPPTAPVPVKGLTEPGRQAEPRLAPRGADAEVEPAREAPARLLDQWIGSLGVGKTALEAVLGEDDIPGVREALAGVTGTRDAFADGAPRQIAKGRDEAVRIGSVERRTVETVTPSLPTVRARVESEPAATTVNATGDAEIIARTVRASQGRIVTCLERSLKGDPTVNGRVSVAWTIRAGRVIEPRLVDNTTTDAALGACVVRAVRTFSFPATLDAEVAELPWVVAGG
ncbi:MAG: AgmX/PglI C-terminal domain-containing protein [Pseudomonadota bacterium]|nr:AgmX/PglI C-terminal domain-containing protein [Pseudomonadota bacterium]